MSNRTEPNYHVLFIGPYAPPEVASNLFALEKAPQVSAIKFQSNLLNGLTKNAQIYALVAPPIAPYPENRTITVHSQSFLDSNSQANGFVMPALNLPIVNLVFRTLTTLYHGFKFLSKFKSNGIIVYSVHSPFVIGALILKRIFKIPAAIFIPDLPVYMGSSHRGKIYSLLKKIDQFLSKYLIQSFDVCFPITKNIAEDWLKPSQRYHVIEGISNSDLTFPDKIVYKKARPKLIYTGAFLQVSKFMELFCNDKSLDAELVFIGGGAEKENLLEISEGDSRVSIHDPLLGDKFEAFIADADFYLSIRETNWPGTKYSFPSKLFEYMNRKTPIISTKLPGIPDEYFECFFTLSDDNLENFHITFKAALSSTDEERKQRVSSGLKLLQKRSPSAVGKIVIDHLRALEE